MAGFEYGLIIMRGLGCLYCVIFLKRRVGEKRKIFDGCGYLIFLDIL